MADVSAFHQSSRAPLTANVGSRWYTGQSATEAAGNGAVNIPPNLIWAVPFVSGAPGVAGRLGIGITTAGADGARAQLGVYAINCLSNLYPHGLILSGSDIAVSSLGMQAVTIIVSMHTSLYWLAILSAGSCAVRGATLDPVPIFGTNPDSFGLAHGSLVASYGYGLLPDLFPTSATVTNSAPPVLGITYLVAPT